MNVRFEISLNGKKLCLAGLESYGVMSAILSSIERNPERVKKLTSERSLEVSRFSGKWTIGGLFK
jgi:hypothetical protein